MNQTFDAVQIDIGFHPDGYRIDRTASAINRYTQWEILKEKEWQNPKPVCFDSMPSHGWIKKDKFNWDEFNMNKGQS